MNHIATIGAPGVGQLTIPPVSNDLRVAMLLSEPRVYGSGEDAHTMAPCNASDHVKAEASDMLASMAAVPRVTQQHMAAWMRGLSVAGLGGAPTNQKDVDAMASLAAMVCCDLPAPLLSREAARIGLSKWKWWPVPADIKAVLVESGAEWFARERALRDVTREWWGASPDRTGEPKQEPTADEHETVRATVAALLAEVAGRSAGDRKDATRAKPRHLTPAQLREAYAREVAAGEKLAPRPGSTEHALLNAARVRLAQINEKWRAA